ncbi:MAG: hypothetical protein JXA09_08555 [Anaerolineae bacterium]|nr:hypothetical protein [Anaerolineae bacterium]
MSDDDLLFRVIDLALGGCDIERVPPEKGREDDLPAQYDLILLALGAAPVEPLVALARTSLLGCVGRIPLLIVSNRRFDPDPERSIYGLGFPFDVHELGGAVRRIVRQSQGTCGGHARITEGMS